MLKKTISGIPYWTVPQVTPVASTSVYFYNIIAALDDFNGGEYAKELRYSNTTDLDSLPKFGGQLCYLSFDGVHTGWTEEEVRKYYHHILELSHGSVLEHASVSFLLYGIDRTVTHELVRHRAGMAFSQVSQRYVGPEKLRYVERLSFQQDPELHNEFEKAIDANYFAYERLTSNLRLKYGDENSTSTRKKANQDARAILLNCVEAPILVTGNLRAWRNFLEQRAHPAADIEIRRVAGMIFNELKVLSPLVFEDYKITLLPDMTFSLTTDFKKV